MAKNKTPARGKGGRFVKGSGGGSKRRASGPTAIVVAAPRAPARRSAPRAPAKPIRRKRRGASVGGHTSLIGSLKAKSRPLIAAAAYSWVTRADNATARRGKEILDKVPTLDALGKPVSHGLLAAFIATRTTGKVRMVFDNLAFAALMQGASNLGARNFSVSEAAKLSGDGDDVDDLSGAIDGDEGIGYEEDEIRGDDDDYEE